jgi:hypothetical protein
MLERGWEKQATDAETERPADDFGIDPARIVDVGEAGLAREGDIVEPVEELRTEGLQRSGFP